MQTAELANLFDSRSQVKMISIAEKNFDAKLFEDVLRNTFYCGLRPDRHENRSVDSAMRNNQAPAAGCAAGFYDFELKRHSRDSKAISTNPRVPRPCRAVWDRVEL